MEWKKNNSGFTIVEALVAIAAIAAVFTAILGFSTLKARIDYKNQSRIQAIFLAEESMEAVHNFRDNNEWFVSGIGILSPDVDYHSVKSSAGWNIILGSETVNNFTRRIIFNRVSRNTDKNIESIYNPANDDPDTRKLSVVVSWIDRYGLASESLTTYITNWK